MWRKVTWLILLLGIVLAAGGCADNGVDSIKEEFNGGQDQVVPPVEGAPPPEVQAPEAGLTGEVVSGEMVPVKVYFSDSTGQYLVEEERLLPKVEGIARATINELIQGPGPESNLLPTIPVGTVLRDINVRPDGLAIVDFSRDLVDNFLGGSQAEEMVVYSIVNTLAQFPTVERVQLRVEGEEIDSLAGHVAVSEALSPNLEIVRQP